MKKSPKNSEILKNSQLSDEKENKLIPTNHPIARKANCLSESKQNKRSENKPKNKPQNEDKKINNLPNNLRNQIRKTASSITGSTYSSKSKNSKLNSLNSSFSSVENFGNPKNNLSKKISPFTNSLTANNITKNNNINYKRSNLNSTSTSVNSILNRQNKTDLGFNKNNKTKKNFFIDKDNTKKFTQQVAKKLNKDTNIFAQKLKNESFKLNADPNIERSYLKELLSLNIFNMEVDACQKEINEKMIFFNDFSLEIIDVKAECDSAIEFYQMLKNHESKEVEELEEELRKFETEKALIEYQEKEILENVSLKFFSFFVYLF